MAANMCLALSVKKLRNFFSVHMTESKLFGFILNFVVRIYHHATRMWLPELLPMGRELSAWRAGSRSLALMLCPPLSPALPSGPSSPCRPSLARDDYRCTVLTEKEERPVTPVGAPPDLGRRGARARECPGRGK